MKRTISLILALLLICCMTAFAETVVIANWSENAQPESVALQYIADQLTLRTNKRLNCEYFANGQLGKEQELYEQMVNNELQITLGSASMFDTYCSKLNPFSFPFLYPSVDACKTSLNGPIGQAINEVLKQNNFISALGDGMISRGFRQLTANRAVNSVEDVRGLQLRLPDIVYFTKCWGAMGANTMNINSTELFTALQTGVCEAQENPTSTNYNRHIDEVQKYYMITNHYADFYTVILNKTWFESLSAEDQTLVMDIIGEAAKVGTDMVNENESKYLAEMEANGMTVIHPEMEGFRKVALTVLDECKTDWEPWVFEQMLQDTGLELR